MLDGAVLPEIVVVDLGCLCLVEVLKRLGTWVPEQMGCDLVSARGTLADVEMVVPDSLLPIAGDT